MYVIKRVEQARLLEALRLAFQSHPEDRFHSLLASTWVQLRKNPQLLDGLFGAFENDRLWGVIWSVISPGRTSVTGLPQVDEQAPGDLLSELLDISRQWLQKQDIAFDQIVLDVEQQQQWAPRLKSLPFSGVVELDFLGVETAGEKQPANQATPCIPSTADFDSTTSAKRALELTWEQPTGIDDPRLHEVVQASHINSLDCPIISGLQTTEEMLEGYQSTGDSGQALWRVLASQGKNVGCCLMSEHRLAQHLEVVYLGVAAQGRRRGFGRRMLEGVLEFARRSQFSKVIAAVDRTNEPAYQLYSRNGFELLERRFAHLRLLQTK